MRIFLVLLILNLLCFSLTNANCFDRECINYTSDCKGECKDCDCCTQAGNLRPNCSFNRLKSSCDFDSLCVRKESQDPKLCEEIDCCDQNGLIKDECLSIEVDSNNSEAQN